MFEISKSKDIESPKIKEAKTLVKKREKKVEEIKKGRKFLYRTSERLEEKYSNKKKNYYNEEVNKWKAPRSKESKEEKKRRGNQINDQATTCTF